MQNGAGWSRGTALQILRNARSHHIVRPELADLSGGTYLLGVSDSADRDADPESTFISKEMGPSQASAPSVASPAQGDVELTTVEVLRALVGGTHQEEALIVAVDPSGFPLSQTRVPRPSDLPSAIVVGRHHRCDLVVPGGSDLGLRHFLFIVLAGRGELRLRCVDLCRRAETQQVRPTSGASLSALGHLTLSVGPVSFYLLPGGEPGIELLQGEAPGVLSNLRNNPTIDRGAKFRPRSNTGRHPQSLGGYRSDAQATPRTQGILRLRGDCDERGRVPHRDIELRPENLAQGLIIGRHGERCTLAGEARNLSRMHALVYEEDENALLIFDLASTNGVRPKAQAQGPSHRVVRVTPSSGCLLGQFHLDWLPRRATSAV